jgi:hypothetical protein
MNIGGRRIPYCVKPNAQLNNAVCVGGEERGCHFTIGSESVTVSLEKGRVLVLSSSFIIKQRDKDYGYPYRAN